MNLHTEGDVSDPGCFANTRTDSASRGIGGVLRLSDSATHHRARARGKEGGVGFPLLQKKFYTTVVET